MSSDDGTALRVMYERHGAAVFHLAQRLLGEQVGAEEVTRLTFVAAWNGRDGFDPHRSSELAWLLGIARRKAADRLRLEAREATTAVEPPPAPDRIIDRLVVADELSRLPADQRRTLELALVDELTLPRIAATTGLPLGTVTSHVQQGMAQLRRRWEVDGEPLGTRSTGPTRAL